MSGYYGRLPKTIDPRDYQAPRAAGPYSGPFVDLSPHFPDLPYDQGRLGSCVANGTAAALDYARVARGLAPLSPPSRLFIYYNGRVEAGYPVGQDSGLQIRDGISAAAKAGAPAETEWPYDPARFAARPTPQAYADALHDEALVYGAVHVDSIDGTISAGYPVVFGFDVFASFEDPTTASTGVMPDPDTTREKQLGGHCVVVVSTVEDGANIPGATPGQLYRKCRNSWGHDGSWGLPTDPGYFWMPVDVMDGSEAGDFWVITQAGDPQAPIPPQPTPGPVPVVDDLATWLRAPAGQKWLHRGHVGLNEVAMVHCAAWLAQQK